MEKKLATGISEYEWIISEMGALIVRDPRDGETIIQIAWDRFSEPDDAQKRALLNVFLSAFHKGVCVGSEKTRREIRTALGLERE